MKKFFKGLGLVAGLLVVAAAFWMGFTSLPMSATEEMRLQAWEEHDREWHQSQEFRDMSLRERANRPPEERR